MYLMRTVSMYIFGDILM